MPTVEQYAPDGLSGPLGRSGGSGVAPGLFASTGRENAPEGGRFVWGVDPSSVRVAVAWADQAGADVETKAFTRCKADTGERHAAIYRETFELAQRLVLKHRPEVVFLEQPFAGKQVEPTLFMAVGCIRAALWEATGVPVRMIVPPSWRKLALGRGNAKKWETLPWARRQLGYLGDSEDEGDALAIAVAGRLLVHPPQQQLAVA